MRLRWVVFLAATLGGCRGELPEVIAKGRFVSYAADPETELCEGTIPRIDAFISGLASELRVDIPDERFVTYYWLPDGQLDESPCDDGTRCTNLGAGGSVSLYSDEMLHEHELVHATHLNAMPLAPPVLSEGLAATYGGAQGAVGWPGWQSELDELIRARSLDPADYAAAMHLVEFTIRRHGLQDFGLFWDDVAVFPTVSGFKMDYEDATGESIESMLDDTSSDLACSIPVCDAVETVADWEDGVALLFGAEDCASPDAVGPFNPEAPKILSYILLRPPAAGPYRVAAEGGLGVELSPCETACGSKQVAAGQVLDLEFLAEDYLVVLGGTPDDAVSLSVTELP